MENFWPEHAAMEVRSLKTLWRPLWKTSALTTTRGKRQPKNMQPGVEPSIRERQRTNHGVWKQRRASAQQKSPARAVLPQFMTALPCPHCLRTFKAKIGLISHLRTRSTPRIWWRRFLPQGGRTHNHILIGPDFGYHRAENWEDVLS